MVLIARVFWTGESQLTVILCLAPEDNDHLNDMPPDVQKLVDPYELSPFITQVGGCSFFHLTTLFLKTFL